MGQITSTEFSNKERELKQAVLETIREIIGEDKIHLPDFTDEANNPLFAINKDDVFFNEDGVDCYPLYELGLLDAIAILSIVEDLK